MRTLKGKLWLVFGILFYWTHHLKLGGSRLVEAGMSVVVEGDDDMVENVGHAPSSPLWTELAVEALVVDIDEGLSYRLEPPLGQATQNL